MRSLKKWFNRTSPFVILSVIIIIVMLYELIFAGFGREEWRYPFLSRLLIFLIGIVVSDLVLKTLISSRNYWIWIIETFLCLALLYFWIVS